MQKSNVKNCRFYTPRCLFEKLGGDENKMLLFQSVTLAICSYIDSPAFFYEKYHCYVCLPKLYFFSFSLEFGKLSRSFPRGIMY